jgi:autotransporter-associated beta strand protein
VQTGGTLTTFSIAQSWSQANGPGVMLGGANTNTSATYSLSGGTLITPNIGCVTENFGVNPPVLVPPSAQGATAILKLNGGVLQASDNDSTDIYAVAEGSAHLIFNTTHTYVQAGGAIIDTAGHSDSISVPLEHYPGGPSDGGLTKMGFGTLTLLAGSTYTGPTAIQAGILACETATSLGGNSVGITNGAQLQLDFTGTTPVYQLIIGGISKTPGVYGSTASGAANKDDTDFVGTGTVTVLGTVTVGETPSFTSSTFAGTAGTGSLTLKGTGGISGGTFLVLGTTNVAAPLADWVTLGQGTFTGAGFNVSIPVTATVPQEFIRIVVP